VVEKVRIRPLCVGVPVLEYPDVPGGDPTYTDSLMSSVSGKRKFHPLVEHVILWAQYWGRERIITPMAMEYIINKHLATQKMIETYPYISKKPYLGIMDITEIPCFENLPDIWFVVRDVFRNSNIPKKKQVCKPTMLHTLVMQALPCFHQSNRSIKVDEFMPVALHILLALMIGLYKFANRKPHFYFREKIYCKLHALMTSTREKQQAFFDKHHCLFILAFMEYIAQVMPYFWPAEYEFLMSQANMVVFFEKTPVLCDEMRIFEGLEISWSELEVQANNKIHKCSRARRLNRYESTEIKSKRFSCDVRLFLDTPVVRLNSKSDLNMLAHAFRIPVHILSEGHNLIQVHDLPVNIKEMQFHSIAQKYPSLQVRFVSSRLHVCVSCTQTKRHLHNKFRIDIETEEIICSDCLSHNVVSIDMLGRIATIYHNTYVLCPVCCVVHPYVFAMNTNWLSECCLVSGSDEDVLVTNSSDIPQQTCEICKDPNTHGNGVCRVNLKTGKMECVAFCYKHYPLDGMLRRCVNTRQVKELPVRRSGVLGRSYYSGRAPFYKD
jgi:hypothetical protein